MGKLGRWIATLMLSLAWPMAAMAQEICPGAFAETGPDGRMYNHLRYAETPREALVPAPEALAPGGGCLVHPAMIADLNRLIADADRDPAIAGTLRAVSCWRSAAYQNQVFCRDLSEGIAKRAQSSAPPGHSEHATGYVIDFGTTNAGGCPTVEGCFAASPAGQWILRNAARYGFEMSFAAGSHQRVTWEPWHWRWVGTAPAAPGAAAARATFAMARGLFPATPRPVEPPVVLTPVSQPGPADP